MKKLFRIKLLISMAVIILCIGAVDQALAQDYWVRPAGGSYGNEDGSNYENALDGLLTVVFGPGGVGPGDTLWVCGTHVHEMTDTRYIASQAAINMVSGTGEESRVTVRGDCPNDPGTIIGGAFPNYSVWSDEGGGVYSTVASAFFYKDWFFININGELKLLEPVGSLAEVSTTPGTVYSIDYKRDSKIYVHSHDGGDPSGRILFNRYGYQFMVNSNEYITFKNLSFFIVHDFWITTATPNHIRFEGCRFFYGEGFMLRVNIGNHYFEVIDSEIAWAGNGIYNICDDDATNCPCNYRYIGNYIHDIGNRPGNANEDAHSIGIQGGSNGWIEGNFTERTGTGPLMYAATTQVMTNNVVIRNYTRNLHTLGGANATGYGALCNNDSLSDKSGNIWLFNVAVNCADGFFQTLEDEMQVYYNLVDNCIINFQSARGYMDTGPRIKYRRNISIDPLQHHIRFLTGAANSQLDADLNIYYPDGPTNFRINTKYSDFDTWKNWEIRSYKFDPNSELKFTDYNSSDLDHKIGLKLDQGAPYFDRAALEAYILSFFDEHSEDLDFDVTAYLSDQPVPGFPIVASTTDNTSTETSTVGTSTSSSLTLTTSRPISSGGSSSGGSTGGGGGGSTGGGGGGSTGGGGGGSTGGGGGGGGGTTTASTGSPSSSTSGAPTGSSPGGYTGSPQQSGSGTSAQGWFKNWESSWKHYEP